MKILLYISLISCRDCSNATSESQDLKKKILRIHLDMEGFGVYPRAGPQPPRKVVINMHGSQVVLMLSMVHKWC